VMKRIASRTAKERVRPFVSGDESSSADIAVKVYM
jgi:hypothetical protein